MWARIPPGLGEDGTDSVPTIGAVGWAEGLARRINQA